MVQSARIIVSITALTILMFGFQNCSEMKFAPADGAAAIVATSVEADGEFVEPDDNDIVDDDVVDNNEEVVDNEEEEPAPLPPVEESDDDEEVVDNDDDKDHGKKDCDPRDHGNKEHNHPVADASSDMLYQCILDGPGKSVRAGFISQEMVHNGRTPDSICTSRAGCELIADVLPVKEIVKRGSCKNNPHVIRLSEEQIQSLIAK